MCTDLLIGVSCGIARSAAKLLIRYSNLELGMTVSESDRKASLHMWGAATFLCLPMLARQL